MMDILTLSQSNYAASMDNLAQLPVATRNQWQTAKYHGEIDLSTCTNCSMIFNKASLSNE